MQAARSGSTTIKRGRSFSVYAEVRSDGSGQASHARLNKHMRRLRHCSRRLIEHGRIALHNQPRNALIPRPRGIEDDYPAIVSADALSLRNRIVVGSRNPNYLGAEAGDGLNPFLRNPRVHKDSGLAPTMCAPAATERP